MSWSGYISNGALLHLLCLCLIAQPPWALAARNVSPLLRSETARSDSRPCSDPFGRVCFAYCCYGSSGNITSCCHSECCGRDPGVCCGPSQTCMMDCATDAVNCTDIGSALQVASDRQCPLSLGRTCCGKTCCDSQGCCGVGSSQTCLPSEHKCCQGNLGAAGMSCPVSNPHCCPASNSTLACCPESSMCCGSDGNSCPAGKKCCGGCNCCDHTERCLANGLCKKDEWGSWAIPTLLCLWGVSLFANIGNLGFRYMEQQGKQVAGYGELEDMCEECQHPAHCSSRRKCPQQSANTAEVCITCATYCRRTDCHRLRACGQSFTINEKMVKDSRQSRETVSFKVVHSCCPCEECVCMDCVPVFSCSCASCRCGSCRKARPIISKWLIFPLANGLVLTLFTLIVFLTVRRTTPILILTLAAAVWTTIWGGYIIVSHGCRKQSPSPPSSPRRENPVAEIESDLES